MPGKFDALKIPVNEAKRMVIVHPATKEPLRDNDGRAAFIDLFSIDGDIARKRRNDAQRRRMKLQDRTAGTPEEFEGEVTALFAELTKDWYLLGLDGTPLEVPCSAPNAQELYGIQELSWIRAQVDTFVGNIANWAPPRAAAVATVD